MRKTFRTRSEVIQAWLQQEQREGYYRSTSGSNFFFIDGTLYHNATWPICTIVTDTNGNRTFVLNTVRYSKTASKHTLEVSNAISGTKNPIVKIGLAIAGGYDNLAPDQVKRGVEAYLYHLQVLLKSHVRSVNDRWLPVIRQELDNLSKWLELYKTRLTIWYFKKNHPLAPIWRSVLNSGILNPGCLASGVPRPVAEVREEINALIQAQISEYKKEYDNIIMRWRESDDRKIGGGDRYRLIEALGCNTLLKVRGDVIVVSSGRVIDAGLSRATYNQIMESRQGEVAVFQYEREGITTYRFAFRRSRGFLHIGCHTFLLSDIKRTAKELGW